MKRLLAQLPSRPELAISLLLVGLMTILVVPLNQLMLDVLVVASLGSCLMVLLMAARIQSPVEMLTFPALILITTMLRLSLNVASTKMILVEGRAGHVIETFGQVVMGGNLLVGLCVFGIVSVVQFMVIAKGADRVAEVAARFSLDAMPGKQMSIDAELRAGSLTAEAASLRREQLDIESRFFGGMDGAMKFVKGDAIAGLIIALVNIIGGMASGMIHHGMTAGASLSRYATLSIGDAMVAQVPSFMIAVAAALVTTRVTGGSQQGAALDLGSQILGEIKRHPAVLIYVGGFLLLMAAMPGFPPLVFIALGCAVLGAGIYMLRQRQRGPVQAKGLSAKMPSFAATAKSVVPPFISEGKEAFDAPIVLALSQTMAEQVDQGLLEQQLQLARQRLSTQWGAPYPGLRCRIEPTLAETDLCWTLNGSYEFRVSWRWDAALALGDASPRDDGTLSMPGFPNAAWQDGEDGASLEELLARVTEHLCVREQARLLTHEQFQELLEDLKASHPQLAAGLAAVVPLPALTDTIRALLREGITLRSLPQVCDMMLSFAPLPQDANAIADMLVTGFSRRRCAEVAQDGVIGVHLIDPAIETLLANYAGANNDNSDLLDLDAFREVRMLMSHLATQHPSGLIVLACRGPGRTLVSEIAAMASCRFRVFSLRGINPRFQVKVLSKVALSEAAMVRMQNQQQLRSDLSEPLPERPPGDDDGTDHSQAPERETFNNWTGAEDFAEPEGKFAASSAAPKVGVR